MAGRAPLNPRREAAEKLEWRFEALVLEPSPPAVQGPPWFADDPTDLHNVPPDRKAVSPVTNTDLTWDEICRTEPGLAEWCADHWLGAYRPLQPLPPGFATTREHLHRLAEHVVAPARYHSNGKIGLRYTYRGFGTPFFASDRQVRVEGRELVLQRGDQEERTHITSLADAARFVGTELGAPAVGLYRPSGPPEPDADLIVDEEAALWLGEWFGFASSVLEQLRWDLRDANPSRVQLWPEHFDLSAELGDEVSGKRAGYGASPGDEHHADPYLYVAPWSPCTPGAIWNAGHFEGAIVGYNELLQTADQRAAALSFFHHRFTHLELVGPQ